MTALRPQRHRTRLRVVLPVLLLVAGSACGTDFLRVETVNPPPTTTSTSTTTTTRPKPTTTTTRPKPATTSTTAATRPKAKATPPPTVQALPPGFGPAGPPPAVPAPPTMAASPLTGLPMDIVRSKRPVLVVKIDNAPKARPQIGLNQADVVFEEGVEGGITRFAALFHSEESKPVGPVRSARSTDIKIVSAFHHPLFAYSGANALFQQYVAEAPLVDVGVDKYPDRYHRDNGRSSPYNLFSDTETLLDLAPDGSVPPPALFAFRSPGAAPSGPGAHAVTHARVWWQASKLTEAIWDWDVTAKGWRRTQNGEAHVDGAGRQVTPANVVVQFVSYHDTGLVDSSGTSVPEADVVGEGDAWVLTGGMLIPCHWSKPSNTELTRYTDASGAEVQLARGKTWVELVPPNQGEAS
ncbi:MAG TPA: DUF3048 domain-containing protein [Acidimicrobiia bacterium]|nr:DUF3048 domain-containing protein [Acidimicrobiia bacterium]